MRKLDLMVNSYGDGYFDFTVHPYQEELYKQLSNYREQMIQKSTAAGKSESIAWFLADPYAQIRWGDSPQENKGLSLPFPRSTVACVIIYLLEERRKVINL